MSSFKKYFQVAKTSWSGGFVYRLNFVMWRVRNVVQLIAIYFLWFAVMSRNSTAFNYTTAQMLTYILGTSLIRALVFGQRSIDAQNEIGSGDLNNYLVKPIGYFKYWFSRDIADKLLNILFSIGEIAILLIWLRPEIYLQTNPLMLAGFLLASLLAMVMYFYFSFLVSMTTFWIPEENGWPQRFLIFVVLEFFSGGLFPLDILPPAVYAVIGKLPSAYFLNAPLQIYLGRFSATEMASTLLMMVIWIAVLRITANWTFRKGLKIYGAYGR